MPIEVKDKINHLFPPEYAHYDTYNRYTEQTGPNIMGKIPEEMMNF